MSDFLEILSTYLEFEFVQYAFIVAIFISLSSSLLGVPLVLRRYSFIGDGLSHVAFGAMTIAVALKIFQNNMPFILIITIIFAILLLKSGRKEKTMADAKLAILSVSSLAFGYLMMNKFSGSSNVSADVCASLFGSISILTLSIEEVYLSVGLSIAVIIIYALLYTKIFALTFDEDFLISAGVNVDFYNIILSIIIATVIVLSMNLVGSLLICALIVFPALTSMKLFKSFKMVVISSAIYSIICTLIGLTIAVIEGTPVGASIVMVDLLVYIIISIISMIFKGER